MTRMHNTPLGLPYGCWCSCNRVMSNSRVCNAFPFDHTSGTMTSMERCGKMVSIGVELLVGRMVLRTVVVSPRVSLSLSFRSYTLPSSKLRASRTFASQNVWFLEQGRFSMRTTGSAAAPAHKTVHVWNRELVTYRVDSFVDPAA